MSSGGCLRPGSIAILRQSRFSPSMMKIRLEFRLIDDFHAIGNGEEPHASGGLAARVGIVQAARVPPVCIKLPRPILETALGQRQIRRQT